uniref:Uncharacterized protein n=1 Tax=Acrobeloides nanus TaxID=290746 RepID=A0A914EMY0_9BILA
MNINTGLVRIRATRMPVPKQGISEDNQNKGWNERDLSTSNIFASSSTQQVTTTVSISTSTITATSSSTMVHAPTNAISTIISSPTTTTTDRVSTTMPISSSAMSSSAVPTTSISGYFTQNIITPTTTTRNDSTIPVFYGHGSTKEVSSIDQTYIIAFAIVGEFRIV